MKFNISFKKQSRKTGLAAVGSPLPSTDIKVNKLVVGMIVAPNWESKDNKRCIRLTVKSGDHCGWRWVTMFAKFEEESKAREWVKAHLKSIHMRNDLHFMEPYSE